jgi:hypothetical protein
MHEHPFSIAVARAKRFHVELKTADPAMAAQLLSAWKELIMGEMVKLLQATNNPKILQHTDENIALAQGATRLKFGVVAGGKK